MECVKERLKMSEDFVFFRLSLLWSCLFMIALIKLNDNKKKEGKKNCPTSSRMIYLFMASTLCINILSTLFYFFLSPCSRFEPLFATRNSNSLFCINAGLICMTVAAASASPTTAIAWYVLQCRQCIKWKPRGKWMRKICVCVCFFVCMCTRERVSTALLHSSSSAACWHSHSHQIT